MSSNKQIQKQGILPGGCIKPNVINDSWQDPWEISQPNPFDDLIPEKEVKVQLGLIPCKRHRRRKTLQEHSNGQVAVSLIVSIN